MLTHELAPSTIDQSGVLSRVQLFEARPSIQAVNTNRQSGIIFSSRFELEICDV